MRSARLVNYDHLIIWLAALGLLACGLLFSERILAANVIVIKAGQIIDGITDSPIKRGVIVIQDDKILAVGPVNEVEIPTGATVIDVPDETILPGLIDTHGHLNLRFGAEKFSDAATGGVHPEGLSPGGQQMIYMIRNARVSLLGGTTTMRMVGAGWPGNAVDKFLMEGIEQGIVPGPRLIFGGTGITATAGLSTNNVDSPWALRQRVREEFESGAEWIKVFLLDWTETSASFSDEELAAIVDEAHRLGIKVTAHATGRWGSAMKAAIRAGVDTIEHARPMSDEIIDLLAENKVAVSLTPLVYVGFRPDENTWRYLDQIATGPRDWIEYTREQYFDYLSENPVVLTQDRPYTEGVKRRAKADFFPSNQTQQGEALAAYKRGVLIGLGIDTIYYGAQGNAIEYLIDAGIAPMAAIRMATSDAAKVIGYSEQIGSLVPGKSADLISMKADPLTERWMWHTINLIMKEGKRYDDLSWQ